ncbi:MAG: acyl-CoA dehydratase activase-related protein [Mycobacterium leprae]
MTKAESERCGYLLPDVTDAPMPPGLKRRPHVGMVLAFTGRYPAVRVLARFLEVAGMEVTTSGHTTPPILEAGATLASADFCFPLRVFVGHVYHLSRQHPDLDAIVAPNVWCDSHGSATCAKYRDVGGVAIRSLGGMLPYLEGRTLPHMVRPNLEEATYGVVRAAAFEAYAAIIGLPFMARVAGLLPVALHPRWAPHHAHVARAFDRAWQEVMTTEEGRAEQLLADATRPRLAVVGRRYLIGDPLLTADLVPWFRKHRAAVVTPWDVPWAELEPYYRRVKGYYDTHRQGQAFIDWAADRVDGFIVLGSFGCHPDGFQLDYLAEYARGKGKPAWTFRFDENAGTAGFQTRFETIQAFLEQGRDRRLAGEAAAPPPVAAIPAAAEIPAAAATPALAATGPARPLFIWPYMGDELNLALEEFFTTLGLQPFIRPPRPIDGATMEVGNRRYHETCSPYACATGSLMESIRGAVADLRAEAAAAGRPPEPRRIILLMVQGEGPCTFGWYALAQAQHLSGDLAAELADGHTLEMLTTGNSDPASLFQQVAQLGHVQRLRPLVRYMEARNTGEWARLGRGARSLLMLSLAATVLRIFAPAWAKMKALERIRAASLLIRAHEREPGSTAAAYRECLERMREAHTLRAIRTVRDEALARLAAVPRDQHAKPRVVAVGEIYASLTSYANRGLIEKLLAREGIEVVETVTVRGFLKRSFWEMGRRYVAGRPRLQRLRRWLEARHLHWLPGRPHHLGGRPWLEWEIGGEGYPGVQLARRQVERGVDGIIHIYPFKCMPEAIARDAYKEMGDYYGVRYLGISFDKEQEIERLKTEVATFAAVLREQAADRTWLGRHRLRWQRHSLGRHATQLYRRAMHL